MLAAVVFATFSVSLATAAPSNSLTLTLLNNTHCLDGTPAGFYYGAPATPNDTWVIFLEGGGACYTKESCSERAKTALGSSKYWPHTLTAPTSNSGAILSGNPAVNPDFSRSHHVYVPYANGDVHAGTRTSASADTWGLYFSGHDNFVKIVDQVLAMPAFASAKRVLLTGSSAGGYGTFVNADYLRSRLPATVTTFKAAPVGGWFFPGNATGGPAWAPPDVFPCWAANETCYTLQQGIVELWQFFLSTKCTATVDPAVAWHCATVHVMYPFIETRMFVIENEADTNQLLVQLRMPAVKNNETERYVKYFTSAMRTSTSQAKNNVLFLASCFEHTSGLGVSGTTAINGHTSGELLGPWFNGASDPTAQYVDNCPDLPCNPTCNTKFPSSG